MYEGPDRRRAKRLKIHFIVIYHVHRPLKVRMLVGSKEVDAVMLDLSQGGMAILTGYDIPISSILSMKFTLINMSAPKDKRVKTIEAMGQVRYNQAVKKSEYRLGILFTQMPKEDRESILSFISLSLD